MPLTAVAPRTARSEDPPICPASIRTLLHGHRYDGSRATRDLGLVYRPIEETLARTLAWYEERGILRPSARA
jgi:dihydroflavonol-4-reductase